MEAHAICTSPIRSCWHVPTSMFSLNFEALMGPFALVVWISFIFYGLVLAQAYVYYKTYDDHIVLKLTVTMICVLQTAQVAMSFHFIYTQLILGFVRPAILLGIVWSEIAALTLELVINALVQSYYIFRVWRLSKNTLVTVFLIAILCARTAVGFRGSAYGYAYDDWVALNALPSFTVLTAIVLSLSVALDIFITTLLMIYLGRLHSRAEKRRTRNVVYRLMYYALSTGGLTTILASVTLVLFQTGNYPVLWGGLEMVLSKVYANSMLAMLNARQGLRQDVVSNGQDSIQPLRVQVATEAPVLPVYTKHTANRAILGTTFTEHRAWTPTDQADHRSERFGSTSELLLQDEK